MGASAGLRKHGATSSSGSVNGFRYNARVLAHHIAEKHFGLARERRELTRDEVVPFLLGELARAPELLIQKGYLARVVETDGGYRDGGIVPLADYVDRAGADSVAVTTEYAADGAVTPVVYVRRTGSSSSTRCRPIRCTGSTPTTTAGSSTPSYEDAHRRNDRQPRRRAASRCSRSACPIHLRSTARRRAAATRGRRSPRAGINFARHYDPWAASSAAEQMVERAAQARRRAPARDAAVARARRRRQHPREQGAARPRSSNDAQGASGARRVEGSGRACARAPRGQGAGGSARARALARPGSSARDHRGAARRSKRRV